MAEQPPDGRSQLAFYAELSQVGVEIAAPIGLGAVLDSWLGISPWLVVIGTIGGFAGAMFHLLKIVGRPGPGKPPRENAKR